MRRIARSKGNGAGVSALTLALLLALSALTAAGQDVGTPDIYEDDDSAEHASWIGIDAAEDQRHNFHDEGDEDWARFYGTAGETVTVETRNLGLNCDTYVELYRADGETLIAENDDGANAPASYVAWVVDADEFYFVRVIQSPEAEGPGYGAGTEYDLRVWRESGGPMPGTLIGTVTNASTGEAIPNARVSLTYFGNLSTRTNEEGLYVFPALPPRQYTVTASADCYEDSPGESVEVGEGELAALDFELNPAGCDGIPGPYCMAGAIASRSLDASFKSGRGDLVLMGLVAVALLYASIQRSRAGHAVHR